MKKLLLGICFSILSPILFAQVIKGVVVDQAQQPIEGATVKLSAQILTKTSKDGRFHLNLISKGSHRLEVSFVGYKTVQVPLTASNIENLRIELEQVSLLLQPIEIQGVRASAKSPFTKTDISKETIAQNNLGRDLPYMIEQTPSVVVSSDAGNGVGYTSWRIRGTDVTRINMTINGIPYNDAESQGSFFVNLPDFASSVSTAQIQRGVGTSSNGAGAFGGSINFATNEFIEKAYGEVNNSFGSFNTWKHTIKAGTGLMNNHFTVDARLSKISSDGYVDRASTDLKSAYLSAAYLGKNSSLRFNLITGKEKTYQAWNGIPESMLATDRTYNSSGTDKPGEPYDNETDNYQQDHYQVFFNHTFSDKIKLNIAGFLSRGRGYYENYLAKEFYNGYGLAAPQTGGQTMDSTDLIRQLWLDNHYYGGVFSVQYNSGKSEIVVGGGWNQYDGNHYGKVIWAEFGGIPKDHRWYENHALKTDFNSYAKWTYALLPELYSFVDLQYRTVKYDINGFRKRPNLISNNSFQFFNPKAGLSYIKNNWRTFVSFSVGNKEPSRDDLEEAAQSRAQHETLYNWEAGWHLQQNRYSVGATIYRMDYNNQLILTGAINDVGAPTRINVPKSYRMGVELEGTARLADILSFAGNITLSTNKVKNFKMYYEEISDKSIVVETITKGDLSFSPPITAAFSFEIAPFKNARIQVPGKYVSKQYLDNTSRDERSLGAYFVQDLRFQYIVPNKIFQGIELMFHVNNLFDKKYESNGYTFNEYENGVLYTYNGYYPMAGIHFMGGIAIKF